MKETPLAEEGEDASQYATRLQESEDEPVEEEALELELALDEVDEGEEEDVAAATCF